MNLNVLSTKDFVSRVTGRKSHITFHRGKIDEFCKRHLIHKMSLFCSYLHGNLVPDCDIGLLIEFEPDHIPGLITLSDIENEIRKIIGRKVDFSVPEDLSRYFRSEIVESAEVQYEQ